MYIYRSIGLWGSSQLISENGQWENNFKLYDSMKYPNSMSISCGDSDNNSLRRFVTSFF